MNKEEEKISKAMQSELQKFLEKYSQHDSNILLTNITILLLSTIHINEITLDQYIELLKECERDFVNRMFKKYVEEKKRK